MNEIIFYIEDSLDGGFEGKALGHSIFIQAETLEELRENVKDAVNCHFQDANRPKLIKLHFTREEAIAI